MRKWGTLRSVLLASSALVPLGIVTAAANPQGPNVVGGAASVSGVGTSSVTVNQSTNRAIINWNSFNIGAGETTRFVQPDSSSVALNRVTGNLGPSQLYGSLQANGRVFVVNPDGILIGRGAVIDTAGFLATTNNITNENFMAGRYHFNIPGRPDASIVNEGRINSHSHGFAALVAPGVRNSGTITARFGKIGLAAGNSFSLDFYGDQLITLAVGDSVGATVRDVATGQPLNALVKNEGTLKANGGRVELTAASARTVVDSVINNTGVIEARSIGHRNGRIVLGGPTESTKVAGAPTQTVRVSGTLNTSSRRGRGGTIQVTGEAIEIKAASFDASGARGGGTILIGGDTAGGAGHAAAASIPQAGLEARAVPTATTVSIDAATTINASATSVGDGGKVIVWADGTTSFGGTILARGGEQGGNGGFAEVSGKQLLNYTGFADMRAPNGSVGTLLLDPENHTIWSGIGPTPAGSSTTAATLQTQLASANVIIQTNNAINPIGQFGDIIVDTTVQWSAATTLTLSAFRDIVFNGGGSIAQIKNTGAGNLILRADSTGTGVGTIVMPAGTNPTRVDWTGSSGAVSVYYNPTVFGTQNVFTTGNGRFDLASSSQLTSYMLVNSLANLAAIGTNASTLGGKYALGNSNITGGTINGIAGNFSGVFDGLGNTISGVTINGPAIIGTNSGTIRNVNLQNMQVAAGGNNQRIAILAGTNSGTISNVMVSGSVSGASFTGIIAGGLVGQNDGTITGSQSLANVTVGDGLSGTSGGWNYGGGLVGLNANLVQSSTAGGAVVVGTNAFGGGLAGANMQLGLALPSITLSSASGAVSSAGTNIGIGGLVGHNGTSTTITASSASGAVTATGSVGTTSCNPLCQSINAGGLVGFNNGTVGDMLVANSVSATGAVYTGSNGLGGGLVGFNSGLIFNGMASGAVTGAAGNTGGQPGHDPSTILGGLVGTNRGLVFQSNATGNVGSANVEHLTAGGLVGDNSGAIVLSSATGHVTAGNFSHAGGLVGTGEPDSCLSCQTGDGSVFFNTNVIVDSTASGNVTAGASSLVGGFAGGGSIIVGGVANGNVTGGANSLIGGFVGAHSLDGFISQSTANGTVTATGSNVWIGGFVGYNGGAIQDSNANGNVSAISNSAIGGFFGTNVGWINLSVAHGTVNASGSNNVMGGFGGLNFGTVDSVSASGAINGAGANIIGGLLGANASFTNFEPGTIPLSSFPVGTDVNSTATGTATGGPGSTIDPKIGVTNPISLPTYPSVIANCDAAICVIFQTGMLATAPQPPAPQPPTPQPPTPQLPVPPTVTISPSLVPNEVLAVPNVTLVQQLPQLPQQPEALIQITPQSFTTPASTGPGSGGSTANQGRSVGGPPGRPPASSAPPPAYIRSNGLPSGLPPIGETRFNPSQVIVQFPANVSQADWNRIAQEFGLTVVSSQTTTDGVAVQFQLGSQQTVRNAIRAMERLRDLGFIQPNYFYGLVQTGAPAPAAATAPVTTAPALRGDPAQYMMGKLQLQDAHRVASGNNVTIAVIDSEVDREHAELAGTIAERFDATQTDPRAHSHGTAMAGAIVSRNRLLGVAPGARILAVRAFSETQNTAESTTMTILKGIDWAVSRGARVINMSFAGPYDPSLERALKDAANKGVILIAASGNAGPKSPPLWPGADPNVIAVTATDSGDKGFRMANRGPYLSVSSPGVEILAPAPQAAYQMSTGTSIATAHVSGVVALMLERDPTLTPRDVRLILESTASDLGPKGRDTQFGWGLVNPAKALAMVDERKRQKGSAAPAAPTQR